MSWHEDCSRSTSEVAYRILGDGEEGEGSRQAELPTSTALQAIKNLKQITREECILPGTSICVGAVEAWKRRPDVGPKLFMAQAPCPTGWLYDPELTAEYAHLAVETGILALKEAVEGVVTRTYIPNRRRLVEAYLQGQGRYRHLFEPTRNAEAIAHIQAQVDTYWSEVAQIAGPWR